MNKSKLRTVYAAIVLLSPLNIVLAADTLNLSEVIDRSVRSNYSLQAAQKQLSILEGKVIQSEAIPNPSVEGSLSQVAMNDLSTAGSAREVGITQTIETGGKRQLRSTISEADLSSARAEFEAAKRSIITQVKESYWNYSFAQEKVEFAQENLEFQQRSFARIQDSFQTGSAKLADVAREKLEVSKAKNDLLVAQEYLKTVKADLNALMGRDFTAPLFPAHKLDSRIYDFNESELQRIAYETRAETISLAAQKVGAKAELQLARRTLLLPDLDTGFSYQEGARADNQPSLGGHVGITLPLWYTFKGERLSAQSHIETLEIQEKDTRLAISLQVHKALLELNLSSDQIKLWREAVDEATEAAREAEQEYFDGTADLLIFTRARQDLVNVKLNYIGSLKDYLSNLAELEQSVGKDLNGGVQ